MRAKPQTLPRWVGTGGWTIGQPGKHGYATLVTTPGEHAKTVKCAHNHRLMNAARDCGQLMAERRNARLVETPE